MRSAKVVTSYIFPPIPDRRWDWIACYDGQEERAQNGFGRTEAEAVADLLENYPSEED